MLTKIFPPLSAETYNLYWFGLLVLTVAMSGVAVIGPNLVQKRNHKALAGWNDFFTRHQLGYISYCFAIFISGPLKSEQKSLKVLIAVVAILALLFFLIGLYWASPSRLRKCLANAQHICPQSTEEECDKRVSRRKKWQILW